MTGQKIYENNENENNENKYEKDLEEQEINSSYSNYLTAPFRVIAYSYPLMFCYATFGS